MFLYCLSHSLMHIYSSLQGLECGQHTESNRYEEKTFQWLSLASLQLAALFMIICTTFWFPALLITCVGNPLMKFLSFTSPTQSTIIRNIGPPPSEHYIKFIKGLLFGSLQSLVTTVTLLPYDYFIGFNNFETWVFTFSSNESLSRL